MFPHEDESLYKAARQASLTLLAAHIGWTVEQAEADLTEALRLAMEALPQTGPISERTEQLLLNALVWVAGELPAWEPLRVVIERFTADAMRRLPSLDGESW